jgi:hypothetical protein
VEGSQMIKRILFFISVILFNSSVLLSYVPCAQTDITVDVKINKYIAETKDTLMGVEDAVQLLGSVEQLTIPAALNKIKIIMSAAQEINIPESLITKDRVHVALLMQFSLSIIEKFKKELINTISILENSKKYWEFYRDHQPLYSTINLLGSRQKKETKINTKIKAIDSYLEKQFIHLGTLALHLDAFDGSKSPDDQCVWLQQLGTIIISAYPGSHLLPEIASCKVALKTLRIAAQCAMHYGATMQAEIRPYVMPSSIKRNWTALLMSVGALAYGSHYAYAQKDKMRRYAQQGLASISDYGKMQYELVKEALFGGEVSAGKLSEEHAILKDDYRKQLTRLHAGLTYNKQKDNNKLEEINEENKSTYVEHAGIKKVDSSKIALFNEDIINSKANSIDLEYLDNVILPVLLELQSVEGGEMGEAVKSAALSIKEIAQKMATIDTSLSKNLLGFGKDGRSIQEILREIKDPIEKVSIIMEKLASYADTGSKALETGGFYGRLQKFQLKQIAWEAKKHNLISLAIISTIPAAIVLWASSKALGVLYKKIRGIKIYDSIRDALIDTAMLLNTYGEAHPSAMLRQDYGRLLYLVHQLEQEQQNMPAAFRVAFSNDIKLLQSSVLSASQKLKVIDLIFKRYPFLLHDPRHTVVQVA